jgi:hypothetical protein
LRLRARFSDDGLLISALHRTHILLHRLLLRVRWSLVEGALLPGLLAAVSPLRGGHLAAGLGEPWRVEPFDIVLALIVDGHILAEGIWLNGVIELVERGVHEHYHVILILEVLLELAPLLLEVVVC